MSTIPKEIMDKIESESNKLAEARHKNGMGDSTGIGFIAGAKYGYKLATDGREEEMPDFKKELTSLLNRYSKESDSNTPDFILAEHLIGSLKVFCESVNNRNTFYVRTEEPDGREELEKENAILNQTIKSQHSLIISGEQRGYQKAKDELQSQCTEKDQEIAEKNDELDRRECQINEILRTTGNAQDNLINQITALQSQCTEKDQEIEKWYKESQEAWRKIEIYKDEADRYKKEYHSQSTDLEELKAENERLRKIIDIVNDRPDL